MFEDEAVKIQAQSTIVQNTRVCGALFNPTARMKSLARTVVDDGYRGSPPSAIFSIPDTKRYSTAMCKVLAKPNTLLLLATLLLAFYLHQQVVSLVVDL